MTFAQWTLAVTRFSIVCGVVLLAAMTPGVVSADRMTDGVVAARQVCGLLGGGSDTKVMRDVGSGRVSSVATCKTAAGEYYCVIGNAGYEQCFSGPFPPKARTVTDAGPHVAPGDIIEASNAPQGGTIVQVMTAAVPEQHVFACEALGGVGTIVTNGGTATVEVHCVGGVLDGMTCVTGHDDSSCTYVRVLTDPAVLDDLTPDAVHDLLEDPAWEGEVIVFNQSGPPVDRAALQTALCGLFGGSGEAGYDLDEKGNEIESRAICTGGLLDGVWCQNFPDESVCIFRAAETESVQIDPAAGNEMPVDRLPVAPTPTAQPTDDIVVIPTPPTEPTVTPTMEPTVPPTMAPPEPEDPPTFPTPPTDDVVAPPGEAEDPALEPTPTVIVLT